jgi:KamA family protein
MNYRALNQPSHVLLKEHKGFMRLPEELRQDMQVVSKVYPFRVNNFVIDQLIDWNNPEDAILKITFPQRGMLSAEDFEKVKAALQKNETEALAKTVREIRMSLNPHPGGQIEKNLPFLQSGEKLSGIQHKYPNTVLFFPSDGQTCHAYCTFCFRWPQFVNDSFTHFGGTSLGQLIQYLKEHEEVNDLLLTGGDPLIMRTANLKKYIDAILSADLSHIRFLRIGTKSLTYWPFRFLNDDDSDELIASFERVVRAGKHLSLVAHINHPNELENENVKKAIKRVQAAGVTIRTQTPLLKGINDSAQIISKLWAKQAELGCVPYYLFVMRDTGPQNYFGVPLVQSLDLYHKAKSSLSGLARGARGPVMSTEDGKIEILGCTEINNEKALVLQFLKARKPTLNGHILHARYDDKALWIDDLKPLFGSKLY